MVEATCSRLQQQRPADRKDTGAQLDTRHGMRWHQQTYRKCTACRSGQRSQSGTFSQRAECMLTRSGVVWGATAHSLCVTRTCTPPHPIYAAVYGAHLASGIKSFSVKLLLYMSYLCCGRQAACSVCVVCALAQARYTFPLHLPSHVPEDNSNASDRVVAGSAKHVDASLVCDSLQPSTDTGRHSRP